MSRLIVRDLYRTLMRASRRPELLPARFAMPLLESEGMDSNSVLSGSTVRKLIRSQFKRNAVDPDPGALEDAFDAARYATERKAAFDMEGAPTSLPAFVYSSPMLPGSVIPLRLFEPRYKAMIRKAMDTDRKFLYVFQDFKTLGLDGVATGLGLVDKVGMVVTIDECRFHEDETADIVGIAGPRVRVTHEVSSETYDGNPLYELGYAREADECEDEKEMKEVRTLSDQCSEILHDIYKYWPRKELESEVGIPPLAEDVEAFSMWLSRWTMASNAPEGFSGALTSTSTLDRLQSCKKMLQMVLDHVEKQHEEKLAEEADEAEKPNEASTGVQAASD